jgi:hypothetical protein
MSSTQHHSAVTGPSWSAPAAVTASPLRRWWHGRLGLPLMIEIVLMGAVFVGYRQVRYITKGDTGTAMENASAVVRMEQDLGVFTERAVQRIVMHSETLIHVLNRYYVTMHFPVTIAFILWAFVRHQSAYRAVRACFLLVTAAGLVLHVAYPLAPPRMLRAQGFVDTLRIYGPRIYSTDTTKSVANQFAAMPSLHFGWALLVAIGFIYIKRTRWSLLALAHPFITLMAIVATGNHYWIDAGVAGVLVVMSVVFVGRFVTGERPAREPVVIHQPLAPAMAVGRAHEAPAGEPRVCDRPHNQRAGADAGSGRANERWVAPSGDGPRASSARRAPVASSTGHGCDATSREQPGRVSGSDALPG